MARYVVQWCFLVPLLLGLLGTAASAQDEQQGSAEQGSADLHGLTPAAPSADPADPLTLWAPPLRSQPRLGLFGLVEYGANPVELKQDLVDADGRVVEPGTPLPLVARVSGLDLSARWTPTWRLSLAVTVPLLLLRY